MGGAVASPRPATWPTRARATVRPRAVETAAAQGAKEAQAGAGVFAGGRRGGTRRALLGAALGAVVLSRAPPGLSGVEDELHLAACRTGETCVSTSSWNSPSLYLPPVTFAPASDTQAFATLERFLSSRGEVLGSQPDKGYVQARLGSDEVEFLFVDGVLCFRAVDTREKGAPPPGCFKRNCINGPKIRGRMKGLFDELGWSPLESGDDGDLEWQQLLLH